MVRSKKKKKIFRIVNLLLFFRKMNDEVQQARRHELKESQALLPCWVKTQQKGQKPSRQ
jgi:hypothetical protein